MDGRRLTGWLASTPSPKMAHLAGRPYVSCAYHDGWAVVPGWDAPTAPGFVVARMDPWRVQVRRVRPGLGVELRTWRAAGEP